MQRSTFILIFILTASELFACECTRGFIGKNFLSNINSFDAIVLVEAVYEPEQLQNNLVVKKVYKGKIEESDTLKLGGGFCSDFIISSKGRRLVLGVFETGSDNYPYELSRCTSSKIFLEGEQAFMKQERSEWGKPRIGLIKRKMKLNRLESRINSKLWWNNLF